MRNFFKTVPRFKRICCCIPLRGGVIALVYINLILSLTAILGFLFLDFIKIVVRMFRLNSKQHWHQMKKSKFVTEFFIFILILCGVAEIIMFVFALIGIHKRIVKYLKLHLYFSVCLAMFLFTYRMSDMSLEWTIELPVALLYLVIETYYILAVRSLVKKMVEDSEDGVHPPLEMVVSYKDSELNDINVDDSNANEQNTQSIETISVVSNGDLSPLIPENIIMAKEK